jgi:hypothetical protein
VLARRKRLARLALVLVMTGVFGLVRVPIAQGVDLLSPADGAAVYSNSKAHFGWWWDASHQICWTFLYLQVATDSSFTNVVFTEDWDIPPGGNLGSWQTDQGPFSPGTYYWRLRWIDSGCVSTWYTSAVRSFSSISPPPPPTLTGVPSISGTPWRGLALLATPGS